MAITELSLGCAFVSAPCHNMPGHALPGDWLLMLGCQAPAEDDKELRRGKMRYSVFFWSRSVMLPADGVPGKMGQQSQSNHHTDISRANQKNESPMLFALFSPWPPVDYVGC